MACLAFARPLQMCVGCCSMWGEKQSVSVSSYSVAALLCSSSSSSCPVPIWNFRSCCGTMWVSCRNADKCVIGNSISRTNACARPMTWHTCKHVWIAEFASPSSAACVLVLLLLLFSGLLETARVVRLACHVCEWRFVVKRGRVRDHFDRTELRWSGELHTCLKSCSKPSRANQAEQTKQSKPSRAPVLVCWCTLQYVARMIIFMPANKTEVLLLVA